MGIIVSDFVVRPQSLHVELVPNIQYIYFGLHVWSLELHPPNLSRMRNFFPFLHYLLKIFAKVYYCGHEEIIGYDETTHP